MRLKNTTFLHQFWANEDGFIGALLTTLVGGFIQRRAQRRAERREDTTLQRMRRDAEAANINPLAALGGGAAHAYGGAAGFAAPLTSLDYLGGAIDDEMRRRREEQEKDKQKAEGKARLLQIENERLRGGGVPTPTVEPLTPKALPEGYNLRMGSGAVVRVHDASGRTDPRLVGARKPLAPIAGESAFLPAPEASSSTGNPLTQSYSFLGATIKADPYVEDAEILEQRGAEAMSLPQGAYVLFSEALPGVRDYYRQKAAQFRNSEGPTLFERVSRRALSNLFNRPLVLDALKTKSGQSSGPAITRPQGIRTRNGAKSGSPIRRFIPQF